MNQTKQQTSNLTDHVSANVKLWQNPLFIPMKEYFGQCSSLPGGSVEAHSPLQCSEAGDLPTKRQENGMSASIIS